MAQANSPAASQDALRTMMYLSRAQQCLTKAIAELNNIKQRTDKVHKEALELEKAVDVADAAEKEVQELQAQLNPKRARMEANVEEEVEIETRVHASTMEIAISGPRGSFIEWMRMPQVLHLRSGIPMMDVDDLQAPVPVIINSSESRGAGFNLQEVIPPALEAAARSGRSEEHTSELQSR